MIVSEVVTRVLHQFGDEASVQVTEADIIRYINDGVREIAFNNDVGQTTATMSTAIDDYEYTPPNDLMSLRALFYNDAKMQFFTKAEFDAYINPSDPTQTQRGTPVAWTKWAGQIIIYPKPDSIGTIKLQYLKKPLEVFDSSDSIPLASEYWNLVVKYCLQQAYQTDEDWDAASQMDGQFQDGLIRAKQQETFADSNEYYPSVTTLQDDLGWY